MTDDTLVRKVAIAIHRVRDPDHAATADGHPWMHDAEWFCAAAEAFQKAELGGEETPPPEPPTSSAGG